MLASVFLYLIETKTGRTLAITAAIAAGIAIGWASFRIHYYNAGWNAAIAAIAAKNKEASDAVGKAISNVDACNAHGGTWNTADGMCE